MYFMNVYELIFDNRRKQRNVTPPVYPEKSKRKTATNRADFLFFCFCGIMEGMNDHGGR